MDEAPAAFFTGLIIGIAVTIFVGLMLEASLTRSFQTEAIERGHALYCPASGDFAWVGECE